MGKTIRRWITLAAVVSLAWPMALDAQGLTKREHARKSIFGNIFSKVVPGDAFEEFTIWRDKSGRELWARWRGRGLYIEAITVRNAEGRLRRKSYFNPERYPSGQEHCLTIISDGGVIPGRYDFEIAYSTGGEGSPTRHFETSVDVEDGVYRGDPSLATATFKKNLSNSLCVDVVPTISGEVYSATLYCEEKRRAAISYMSPTYLAKGERTRYEFKKRNIESGTKIQLVLEGYRYNRKPFYLCVEGVMP